jgi:hypothetical protein
MKKLILLFIFYYTTSINAQSIEIIHQSKEKNDNVVGNSIYLENKKDTARGRYVATFRLNCLHHPANVLVAFNLLKIKLKEIGANSYFLESFIEADSTYNMRIKAYLTFTKAYKENEDNNLKNKTIVFNYFKQKGLYKSFYLNDSIVSFPTSSFLELPFTANKPQTIKLCNKEGNLLDDILDLTQDISQADNTIATSCLAALGLLDILGNNSQEVVHIKNKIDSKALFICLFGDSQLKKGDLTKGQKNHNISCSAGKLGYQEGRLLMELLKPTN